MATDKAENSILLGSWDEIHPEPEKRSLSQFIHFANNAGHINLVMKVDESLLSERAKAFLGELDALLPADKWDF